MALIRMSITVAALLVPFCACHCLMLLGRVDGCCAPMVAAAEVVPTEGLPAAALPVAARLASDGGARNASESCPAGVRSDCCSVASARSEEAPDIAAPGRASPSGAPPKKRKPTPACSRDTCCVKSAPSPVPWQLPAPTCIEIIEPGELPAPSRSVRCARRWPPTLPLGQPPTPIERGTLLLV